MPTTRANAIDEMFQCLLDGKAGMLAIVPDDDKFEMRWQGIETPDEVSDAGKQLQGHFWTRAVTQVVDSRQSAHTMEDLPDPSDVIYTTVGQIIVQVFAPRNVKNSYSIGGLLADYIAGIYRRVETPSGVWFRRATAKDTTSELSFWRWNVTADFEFYERT